MSHRAGSAAHTIRDPQGRGKERASADSRAGGHDAAAPIMSGTLLVARVIESHPAMAAAPEVAEKPCGRSTPIAKAANSLIWLGASHLEQIGRDLLKRTLRS